MVTQCELPVWKPRIWTMYKIKNTHNLKKAFSSFQSSCKRYASNPIIRAAVFIKCNNECSYCGSKESLEVDHIFPVLRCFKRREFHLCNSLDNLQVLCKKCNSSKGCY